MWSFANNQRSLSWVIPLLIIIILAMATFTGYSMYRQTQEIEKARRAYQCPPPPSLIVPNQSCPL